MIRGRLGRAVAGVFVTLGGLACAGGEARAQARGDRPPRKVVVGTAIFGPFAEYPGLPARLGKLERLVDEMASQARAIAGSRGLDLAILPESTVSSTRGDAVARALRLDGPVSEALGAIARKHRTYLVACLDLLEGEAGRETVANAAVLFGRDGKVAGIYRKIHPVAVLGTDELERGVTPGREVPVFDCDFGRLGIQICWDVQFDDGWEILAKKGAELVAWPTASPATAQPASRAAKHRYYVVSSTWREDASVFEPTGLIGAQVEGQDQVLVHQLDLSFAVLGWSAPLRDGQAFRDRYGDRAGFHYRRREDLGLFWSNDPRMPIAAMLRELGLEELDVQVARNRRLQDAARNAPVR